MALNPQLIHVTQAYSNQGSSLFPQIFQGEMIFCSREQSHFKIDGPRQYKGSFAGTIFLTNFRMVFVLTKPTPTIQAIEIPLLYITNEKMSQPIFGANNLSGLVTPVDAPPNSSERIAWKLAFTNGGMGTLVPLFFSTLEYLRVSSRRRHQEAPQPEEQPQMPSAPKPEPPSFIQAALLDPNDPTKVYLTSPVDPAQANPEKYPVV